MPQLKLSLSNESPRAPSSLGVPRRVRLLSLSHQRHEVIGPERGPALLPTLPHHSLPVAAPPASVAFGYSSIRKLNYPPLVLLKKVCGLLVATRMRHSGAFWPLLRGLHPSVGETLGVGLPCRSRRALPSSCRLALLLRLPPLLGSVGPPATIVPLPLITTNTKSIFGVCTGINRLALK